MIPNHKEFIRAIQEKNKVCLRFFSKADSSVVDLVCAPMDYGPGTDAHDGVNRYWFWDYSSNTGSPTLGLFSEQVLDVRILGDSFDPADFKATPPNVLPLPKVEVAPPSAAPNQASKPAQTAPPPDAPPTESHDPHRERNAREAATS